MGRGRGVWRAACATTFALLCAKADASVVAGPIARLSVEGGYDSNVLYDGGGGSSMGHISPELGLHVRDHLWDMQLSYGGDVYAYGATRTLGPQRAWNHRGLFRLEARPRRSLTVKAEMNGSYSIDPVGLARLGLFQRVTQPALLLRGSERFTWRSGRRLSLSFTYAERDVLFDDRTGAGAHTPGVEAAWKLSPRSELGGAYRFDVFQASDPVLGGNSRAHELKAVYRYRLDRTLELEAEAGPAWWIGSDFRRLVPEASLRLAAQWREGAARVGYTHGVGLGSTANPGLSDGLEGVLTRRLSRHWRVHAEGGLWRGADMRGEGTVWGYSVIGEVTYLLSRDVEIALAASRFARLDDLSPILQRNVLGLRVAWQLPQRP